MTLLRSRKKEELIAKAKKVGYASGFNDAIDILQAQRYRKKRVGEIWRISRLLDYFSDEGRKR